LKPNHNLDRHAILTFDEDAHFVGSKWITLLQHPGGSDHGFVMVLLESVTAVRPSSEIVA